MESSLLGDTQINQQLETSSSRSSPINQSSPPASNLQITIEQLEQIFDKKLETLKQSIIAELNNSISHQIKQEINPKLNSLTLKQESLSEDIAILYKNINELKTENRKLESEIKNLYKNIRESPEPIATNQNMHVNMAIETNNENKFILYGTKRNPWENEEQLNGFIVDIFQDILNINISGYIEDVRRLGRDGPLMIELLSKKMTRYILQNAKYFSNTKLSVSKYLDEDSRQHRKELINILIEARQKGQRANIRNNQLYIDGRLYAGIKNQETPENHYRDQPNKDKPEYLQATPQQMPQAQATGSQSYTNMKKVQQNHNFRNYY